MKLNDFRDSKGELFFKPDPAIRPWAKNPIIIGINKPDIKRELIIELGVLSEKLSNIRYTKYAQIRCLTNSSHYLTITHSLESSSGDEASELMLEFKVYEDCYMTSAVVSASGVDIHLKTLEQHYQALGGNSSGSEPMVA